MAVVLAGPEVAFFPPCGLFSVPHEESSKRRGRASRDEAATQRLSIDFHVRMSAAGAKRRNPDCTCKSLEYAMQSRVADKPSSRPARSMLGSVVVAISLCATTAAACDPNNGKHVPCPASAQMNYVANKPATGTFAPGPAHAKQNAASASEKQSTIFAGGKPSRGTAAINPQQLSSGHANGKTALNPQPIPPGKRVQSKAPRPDHGRNTSN